MDKLRVLAVGPPDTMSRVSIALGQGGHTVLPVDTVGDALEALSTQRFDAVLLSAGVPESDVAAFGAKIKDLHTRTGSANRVTVLSVTPEGVGPQIESKCGIDGFVPDGLDPDTLTLAIARLASAVGADSPRPNPNRPPDLPILDIEQLKEQVAFDDELLVELIDLFLTERLRQSEEMRETLSGREYERLSRVAHTLKGSLSSLHAGVARADAQALELAAKAGDELKCGQCLKILDRDLDVLEEHLLALRRSISAS